MKIVINNQYGGFSLSPLAVKRMAELQGRPCFFFIKERNSPIDGKYIPCTQEEAKDAFIWWAFDVENPDEVILSQENWHEMTDAERSESNASYKKHQLDSRSVERNDPVLIRVVEELGEKADGSHASLKIVEIPDGVDYQIEEYDGIEWIAESHRTWR